MKIGRYILIAALFVAVLGTEVAGADGGYTAHARQPAYETSSLQLIGRRRLCQRIGTGVTSGHGLPAQEIWAPIVRRPLRNRSRKSVAGSRPR